MPNNDYANEPNQSRSEDIIQSILDNTEYDEEARSRIEYLLIELKNAIEGGGGGGGVTSYSPLTEKPKIDDHTLQAGNNSSSDLGLQTKLTFDSSPAENSTNPVTSGGVYTALGTKANSADVYNKSDVDTALTAKADKSTIYTKTEVDTALNSKQNTISDLSTIRSGASLGATAVQPVSGKGLSTNDYTNDEKSKLAGIEAQANKTTVDSALSGTSTNPVQNKVVKSALAGKQATLTTSQLAAVNSGITAADVEQITENENNILYNTNQGVKNIFRTPTIDTTSSGINVKTLSDGQLKVTSAGTNTSAVYIDLETSLGSKYVGYKLSGGSANVGVYISNSGGTVACSVRGDEVSIPSNATNKLFLTISANTPAFEETIYVMIRKFGDRTYQPYALSNVELTYNISLLTPQIVSTNITELAAESYADGTVCGYANSFAGLSAAWVVIRTYTLNREGPRKMQIVEVHTGNRKTRFFNGAWGAWS